MAILTAEPIKVAGLVRKGFQRMDNYRRARSMFVREYCGQYFKVPEGVSGDQPINMVFATIRAYVPNLVMVNPVNQVVTDVVALKDYAYFRSQRLNQLQKKLKIKNIFRGGIVNGIFGMGILETGLCASDSIIELDDVDVDPGQVFTKNIDIDDLVIDPDCVALDEANFIGHLIRVRRADLLEIDGLDRGLIMQMPLSAERTGEKDRKVEDLSKRGLNYTELADVEDYVEVVRIWVPDANAFIYMADPRVQVHDKFIGVKPFYGPKTGPYSFLSLSQPVPNNPLPIPPVGIWYDLHTMINRSSKKLMERLDKQRDVFLYRPMYADLGQDLKEAMDQDWFASDDPQAVNKMSLGGVNPGDVEMLNTLQFWYNYIAGNPDQLSGVKQGANTATQAQILQSNASIVTQDYQDTIEDWATDVGEKQLWYLDTDPLIQMSLPIEYQQSVNQMTCRIKRRSMQRLDPMVRSKRIIEFCTNVLPGVVVAAQQCMQMGIPFNLQKFLTNIAEEIDISDFMVDVFNDPDFQKKLNTYMQFKSDAAGEQGINPRAIAQNSGLPSKKNIMSPSQESNQFAQMTSAESQGAQRMNLEV